MEGPLAEVPLGNTARKEPGNKAGMWGSCIWVKRMVWGFYCSYCDAALKMWLTQRAAYDPCVPCHNQ